MNRPLKISVNVQAGTAVGTGSRPGSYGAGKPAWWQRRDLGDQLAHDRLAELIVTGIPLMNRGLGRHQGTR